MQWCALLLWVGSGKHAGAHKLRANGGNTDMIVVVGFEVQTQTVTHGTHCSLRGAVWTGDQITQRALRQMGRWDECDERWHVDDIGNTLAHEIGKKSVDDTKLTNDIHLRISLIWSALLKRYCPLLGCWDCWSGRHIQSLPFNALYCFYQRHLVKWKPGSFHTHRICSPAVCRLPLSTP